MNKSDFIELYAAKNGIGRSQAERFINSFINMIYDALRAGDTVQLSGFGTFSVAHRQKRIGVNPRRWTEKIVIPAFNLPKFKAGEAFKAAVKLR